jgi:hypothetical protein
VFGRPIRSLFLGANWRRLPSAAPAWCRARLRPQQRRTSDARASAYTGRTSTLRISRLRVRVKSNREIRIFDDFIHRPPSKEHRASTKLDIITHHHTHNLFGSRQEFGAVNFRSFLERRRP